MKANELRIGNFVLGYNEKPTVVDDINGFNDGINKWQDMGASGYLEDPKPIPLTEEWLVKFGFSVVDDACYVPEAYNYLRTLNSGSIEVSVGELSTEEQASWGYAIDVFLHTGDSLKHIIYVHQLQNLYYALTGEELTT